MQIDETVHGCPVGRRCGSPDRQGGDPGSPSQIRTTSGQPPLVAAGRLRYELSALAVQLCCDLGDMAALEARAIQFVGAGLARTVATRQRGGAVGRTTCDL